MFDEKLLERYSAEPFPSGETFMRMLSMRKENIMELLYPRRVNEK